MTAAGGSITSSPGVTITTSARRLRSLRTPVRVVTALFTALSLMVAVDPATASAKTTVKKPVLSVAASPATVLPHNSVAIAGTVTPRGSGALTLQRYVAHHWVNAAHKSASRTGTYSFAVRTSGTVGVTAYRVVRSASGATKALTSATTHVRVTKTAFKVTAVGAVSLSSGSPIVVTGSVKPKAKGIVYLEALQHGAWHLLATARLTTSSAYSVSKIEPTGTYAVRVRAPFTSTVAGGVSKSLKVTVSAPMPGAPTAHVTLSGTLASPGVYTGQVVATATTTASAGTRSISYMLDAGTAKTYTAPVAVTSAGNHTFTVTITDALGRVATATVAWSTKAAQVDVTPPSVSVTLNGGTPAGTYSGQVNVQITAADTSGVKSIAYSLDGAPAVAYTGAFTVAAPAAATQHRLTVTAIDTVGNVFSSPSPITWTQLPVDTTKPTGSILLNGSAPSAAYTGQVSVTIVSADNVAVQSVVYTRDGGAATPYGAPFTVTSAGNHTVTATITDTSGNQTVVTASWSQQLAAGTPDLLVGGDDHAALQQSNPRITFALFRGTTAAPRTVTLTNTTTSAIVVSGLTIKGTNASDFSLSGVPSSFTLAGGASASLTVSFHPPSPTNCASDSDPSLQYAISPDVDRAAFISFSTSDPAAPSGSIDLSGANACGAGGNGEPVLDQVLTALGYEENTYNGFDRRFIGPSRWIGNDEVIAPYFTAANPAQPVSLVPIAHYGSPNTSKPYQTTGWYAKGATMSAGSGCTASACKALWDFVADSTDANGATVYNENQKLLPAIDTNPADTTSMGGLHVTQSTQFNPSGPFGIFSSDFSEVNFSDDALNTAHTGSGGNETTSTDTTVEAHYLHQMRVYPAYGPGHVLIPNTYIIGDDLSRVPSFKNNDYQDVVMLLSNATPATAQATTANVSDDFTGGGTVDQNTCLVSGFDAVLPASKTGAQSCVPGNIAFAGGGLQLTSTAGQLANNDQANALYKTFDATRGAFTIDAHITGGLDQITSNYRQIGAFFGPDDKHFIKVEAEHNGAPGLTMFYEEPGDSKVGTIASVPVDFTGAQTLDLIIKGNTNVKAGATDSDPGYPLAELTAWYSINGGTPVQIDVQPGTPTIEYPFDVTDFFSRSAKAGILDSNSGSTPFTATFGSFSITHS